MSTLLIASLPPLMLLLLNRRLSPEVRLGLKVLSIPFVLLLFFYSIIFAIALVLAGIVIWQIQKWRFKRTLKSKGWVAFYNRKH